MKRLVLATVLMLLVLNILIPFRFGLAKSSQATVTVPDDYPTIQAAVNASGAGATIFIKAGTYHEHVTINKSLSLVGEAAQNTTIDGDDTSGNVVFVTTDNVTLSDLTIRNSQVGFSGIRIDSASNCNLSDNYVVNNWYGVILHQCSGSNVVENNIRNNADGVHIESLSRNDVVNGNTIIGQSFFGVHLISSSNISIAKNNVANNAFGIYLDASSNNQITQNNASYGGYGMYLDTSSENSVVGNSITGNNMYGVYFYSYSNNNIFYNNDFGANKQQVNGTGGQENIWENAGKGNYWSDYLAKYPNATEIDASGSWNIPYTIDADNADHHPLVSFASIPEFPSPAFLFVCIFICFAIIIAFKRKHRYVPEMEDPPH